MNNYNKKYVALIKECKIRKLSYYEKEKALSAYLEEFEATFDFSKFSNFGFEKVVIGKSIVFIAGPTEDGFLAILEVVKAFQKFLAKNNTWVHGGISYGDIFYLKETKIIVGKGFTRVIKMEQVAQFPRVLIDQEILYHQRLNRDKFYEKYSIPNNLRGKLIHYDSKHIEKRTKLPIIFVCYAYGLILDSVNESKEYDESELAKVYGYLHEGIFPAGTDFEYYFWVKQYFAEVLDNLLLTKMELSKNHDPQWLNVALLDFKKL